MRVSLKEEEPSGRSGWWRCTTVGTLRNARHEKLPVFPRSAQRGGALPGPQPRLQRDAVALSNAPKGAPYVYSLILSYSLFLSLSLCSFLLFLSCPYSALSEI